MQEEHIIILRCNNEEEANMLMDYLKGDNKVADLTWKNGIMLSKLIIKEAI